MYVRLYSVARWFSNALQWRTINTKSKSTSSVSHPLPSTRPPTMSAQTTVASEYSSEIHSVPIEHRFNPYSDNGGTVLGIAGEDFAVLAGDTRQVEGYSIQSRYEPKIHNVGDNILMTANGFAADGIALIDKFKQSFTWYKFDNGNRKLEISSAARYIQHLLYGKRFFPYYVSTLIAGLDEEGKGAVYSYDPVGSYEREQCRAGGAAASLIMPFLDNQVNFKNQFVPETDGKEKKPLKYLSLEEVIQLVRDAFNSAGERHIYVGDGLEILIVTKDGVRTEYFPLKRD